MANINNLFQVRAKLGEWIKTSHEKQQKCVTPTTSMVIVMCQATVPLFYSWLT